jgi:hypothetical protein
MKITDKTSKIIYYIGLFLLAIGAFGLTFAAFFAFIGLPVFIVGIVLIFISKKSWKHKLILIAVFIVGIFAFWPIWRELNSVGPETFLIPNDYRGKASVIYKKGCGINLEKTNDTLIYNIPENGILILDGEQEYGLIEHTYFLVDDNGNRTELPKMDVRNFNEEWTLTKNPNEPSRDKLGVFHWGRTGSIGEMIDKNGETTNENDLYTFSEFYVSTYNDLKTKFSFKYEQKNDSIIKEKMKDCE